MTKRVLSYGVVGLLALALVGGTAYILLNPTQAQAERGLIDAQGQGRGRGDSGQNAGGTADGVAAYGQGQGRGRGNGGNGVETSGQGAYGRGQDEELTAKEIEGILYMREEEKLARDVYLTLYEQWDLSIFQNIANSEQTHMDAVKTLIDRYGLDDPAAGNDVGEFTDPTLGALYADLVATGGQSLTDALHVGAAIEEIDILDLEDYVSQTDAWDIQRVYGSLTKGSRNHLRSFVATLERQTGETYEPQYLDQGTYDDIVSASVESGGYGQGLGRGGARQVESGGSACDQGKDCGNDGSALDGMQGRGGSGSGNSGGVGASDGRGRSSGAGQGRNETMRSVEWEPLTGRVALMDGEVTLQTSEGEVLVGMGQSSYWEGFALEIGDEVSVLGFYEDGEFKAGTVENLTTGETIMLRDEAGRPMWAGNGRFQNQGL
jgi:hypothetical protein